MHKNRQSGYTLLETVIALVLLFTIAVPLLGKLYSNFFLAGSELELNGMWFCEQEAALIKEFPEEMVPVRRKYIKGQEWVLRTDKTGTAVQCYEMKAFCNNKQRSLLIFYGSAERSDD